MAFRPYFLLGYESVAGSATETLTIEIGATEHFVASAIRIKSTGAFDLVKLTDQGGMPYTNATSTKMIDSDLLTAATKNRYHEIVLPTPWDLKPETTLSFEITDTSATTNEVWILLIGKMESAGATTY